jgi:hypothetical protein
MIVSFINALGFPFSVIHLQLLLLVSHFFNLNY